MSVSPPAFVGLDFGSYIAERTWNFTGRAWLFTELEAWLADSDASQVFILLGEPGIGKTAIAGRLVEVARGEVAPPEPYRCIQRWTCSHDRILLANPPNLNG